MSRSYTLNIDRAFGYINLLDCARKAAHFMNCSDYSWYSCDLVLTEDGFAIGYHWDEPADIILLHIEFRHKNKVLTLSSRSDLFDDEPFNYFEKEFWREHNNLPAKNTQVRSAHESRDS